MVIIKLVIIKWFSKVLPRSTGCMRGARPTGLGTSISPDKHPEKQSPDKEESPEMIVAPIKLSLMAMAGALHDRSFPIEEWLDLLLKNGSILQVRVVRSAAAAGRPHDFVIESSLFYYRIIIALL